MQAISMKMDAATPDVEAGRPTDIMVISDLTVRYATKAGPVEAVRHASLRVREREVLGIVGESGSGKSTLAQAMMGYCPQGATVPSGKASFKGVSLLEMPRGEMRAIWGRKIAMVHQNALATLTPTMTIGDQIAETIRQHTGASRAEAHLRALEALAAVNMPTPEQTYHRYPHQLSGGQRQRISIAIALSLKPDLLILDEPTTALDVTTEAVILDLLRDLKATTQAAMIYISHNLAVVARIADRVAVMYAGEIVEVGETQALFRAPSHPYTRALIDCLPTTGADKRRTRLRMIQGEFPSLRDIGTGCVFRSRCTHRTSACETSPDWKQVGADQAVRCFNELAESRTYHEESVPATELTPGDTIELDIDGLTKTYGRRGGIGRRGRGTIAVDHTALHAHGAEIVGLVGESGSGKTSLLRCIAGLTDFEAGRIHAAGAPVEARIGKRGKDKLQLIQMVFQDPAATLNPAITVGENLVRHIRALRGLDVASARAVAIQNILKVKLNRNYFDRYPGELSGGEKQRVAIARAFSADPSIILCDEPLSALDVSVQSSVVQLLLDLQAERKTTYILVSHDISIVRYAADRIVVMYLGRIVDEGSAESFEQPPLHPYTEALLSAVPSLDGPGDGRIRLERHVSANDKDTAGCAFAARCPRFIGAICREVAPPWQQAGDRRYLCHHAPEELALIQSMGGLAGHLPNTNEGASDADRFCSS